jgi:hypothetical protein
MRLKHKRRYHIPLDSTPVLPAGINAIAFFYGKNDKIYGLGFSGKRQKPDFHHRFRSLDHRLEFFNRWVTNIRDHADQKTKNREAQKQTNRECADLVKVGDIFRASWGYDQTNVDYYQVTEKKGQFVTVREIAAIRVEGSGGHMCDRVTPDKDNFLVGDRFEPKRRKIQGYKNSSGELSPCIKAYSFANAYLWDGGEDYRSWYH